MTIHLWVSQFSQESCWTEKIRMLLGKTLSSLLEWHTKLTQKKRIYLHVILRSIQWIFISKLAQNYLMIVKWFAENIKFGPGTWFSQAVDDLER